MSVAKKEIEELRKQQEALLSSEPNKFWKSVEETYSSPESIKQHRGQEFVELPKDIKPESSVSRRGFLKWVSAAGTLMAGTACSRRPKDYLVPYVHKPQGLTYGAPLWYASTTPDGLGVLVKTREGRPIKLEGNPDHMLSKGGLNATAQAEILNLYNPERLRNPKDVKQNKTLTWEQVDSRVKAALSSAKKGGVRLLTDHIASPSLQASIDSFSKKYSAQHTSLNETSYFNIARAHEIISGTRRVPYFDFEKADVVVSVDADFLGTWLRPVEFTKAFSKRRNLHRGETNINQSFVFESALSVTGANADYRFPIKPSQELKVLMALANELSKEFRLDPSIKEVVRSYDAQALADELKIDRSEFDVMVASLSASKSKSLVVAGNWGPHALECQLLCVAINKMLDSYGNTIHWNRAINVVEDSEVAFNDLISDALEGKVEVLIIRGVNPLYSRPNSDFARALENIPMVVCLTPEMNETAGQSTIAAGESHFLESWGDSEAIEGSVSIQQPVIMPLFKTRGFGEALYHWEVDEPKDYREQVKSVWQRRLMPAANFISKWKDQLRLGYHRTTSFGSGGDFTAKYSGAAAILKAVNLSKSNEVELFSFESVAMGVGRNANNAFLQELPDPISKVTWENYAAISVGLAKKLGITIDEKKRSEKVDVVQLKAGAAAISLPTFIMPGLRDDVVAVALGYGRKIAGSLGSDRGANAFVLSSSSKTGEAQLSGISVDLVNTGRSQVLATTQRHFDLHGRDNDILHKTTLGKFLKDPKAAEKKAYDNFSMYDPHPYPGHRWGMNIDLTKCTGCNACVVACYAENNVPVVGKDEVAKGRHMAWLRLDLYHEGSAESLEDSSFEPMLCQHCEMAPCETVCPVLATVHSSDGLNDMIYNRCVGTRYCANNCPYKVRRFNYFQYSDNLGDRKGDSIPVSADSPLAMMLNPDVTVRTRGVMEKCTFCVQRIRKGVDKYKAKGFERVPDQSIKTACQQSCPADAITFGDLNDARSDVSLMAKKAQSFKVLDVLNTNPSVTYMPKVRNKGSVDGKVSRRTPG